MDIRTKEILENHNLNWSMEKVPMTYQWENQEVISNKQSLIRTDNGDELNVVGNKYVPMQNETMVEAAIKASDNYGELSIVDAGSMRGGKKVFLKFKITGESNIHIGNETLVRYITLLNNNDGTGAFRFAVGNMVMSCDNQFHYFDEDAKLKMYHSTYLEEVISHLDKYLEKALAVELKVLGRFRVFQSTSVTRQLAEEMVDKIIVKDFRLQEGKELSKRMKNKKEMFMKAIDIEMNNKGENAFGLFNGITYATNHFMSGDQSGLLFGQKARINRDAYKYLEDKIILV